MTQRTGRLGGAQSASLAEPEGEPRTATQRPIIFSAPMVRAILAGTKTQTRRIVRPLPFHRQPAHDYRTTWHIVTDAFGGQHATTKMPCLVGDELWVRETVCIMGETVIYAADWSDAELRESATMRRRYPELAAAYPDSRWRPSIHMPRAASRITLRVTAVRVERLQEISEDDALDEGCVNDVELEKDATTGHAIDYRGQYARERFEQLWDSINAKRAPWSSNPWVWVITFERVQP